MIIKWKPIVVTRLKDTIIFDNILDMFNHYHDGFDLQISDCIFIRNSIYNSICNVINHDTIWKTFFPSPQLCQVVPATAVSPSCARACTKRLDQIVSSCLENSRIGDEIFRGSWWMKDDEILSNWEVRIEVCGFREETIPVLERSFHSFHFRTCQWISKCFVPPSVLGLVSRCGWCIETTTCSFSGCKLVVGQVQDR